MSTKPCLFDKPLTGAERQKRWRTAHPEARKQRTLWMQEWREKRPLRKFVLSDGQYTARFPNGDTTHITVKPGASMTIWTQSTIERV